MRVFAYALLAALLSFGALAEPDDWSWKDDGESQQFTADDAQVAATSFSEPAIANATDLDEVIDSILTRQGRNLEEFDEVYTDPNVQEALQKGDDGEARNLIREKLCGLGLMQCDDVQGKRPYIAPEDLVYAQPVAINPVGRPIPTIPLKGGPIRGGYGPPKPMPFPPGPPPFKYGPHKPHGPPRREFGPPKTYYPNRPPFQSSGSSYSESSSFESSRPPFGNIQSEFPYEIESSSFGHKDKKPVEVIVNAQGGTATGASGVQQHVHHHFHHGDEKIPAVVVSPVASGVAGGNFIQSSGFKPSPSLSFGGYKEENGFSSSSSGSSILGGSGSYGSSGLTSGSFGSSGLNSGSFGVNSGSFGVNSGSFGVNSGSFGVNSGSFGVNSASFGLNSKPSLTIGGGGSGIYGGQSTASYGGSTGLGTYGGPKPISESYGPQTFGSSLYTNSIGASVGSYGSSDFYKKELNINGGGALSNSLQSGYGDKFQGFESARNENYDCVCVPYDQCPSHEVIGRKDDLSLPLDPRSLKTDIEAEDERVVTDGNGTMTIVRVTKEAPVTPVDVAKTGETKKVKREAAAEKKEDKTQTDGRQLGDFTKNIKPTFGVSFGLPNQGVGGSPYPNPLGPPHYADPYLNNGINLGLVSVNPLVSVQVTKNDYGEKVVKPFVNLHVTPNHFLIHKVKDFFDYKKGQIFNKHEHYHHHLAQKPHYDRPHYYSEHGPPEYFEDDHHRPYYHQPPQYHQSPQYHQPPLYHQHQHQHHGYYDDSFNYGGGGGGFEQFDDDYYGRSALNYTNGKDLPGQYQNQYDDQNYYAQSQDSYGNPVNYEQDYSRQGKDLQLSSPVRFPTSRKRRDLNETQKTNPDTQIEKRQAYYGGGGGFGRPPTCGPRHVCCRRPIRPNVPTSSTIRQCGTRHSQGINGRIKNPVYVDGDSEFGEYPWQVAILKKDPKESVYVCGGTLIDPLHILTAAHCVKSYTAYDIRVRLGEWDVNHDVEFYPYVERDVSRVEVHPEFYTGTLYNDIAILRMDKPVDFSRHPHIGPACLPSPREDYTGARCWTTGWGKDAFGDFGKYQNILKETDVPIVGNELCQRQLQQTRLGYDFKLHPGFVCAGGEEGKDACKGDGGGPMVCERGGSWNVVGVVSWGIGCGQIGVPGVYVKVAHYLDWIRQVTQRF